MEKYKYFKGVLEDMEEECEEIKSSWNGEDANRLEDKAHIAGEMSERIKELLTLAEELENV